MHAKNLCKNISSQGSLTATLREVRPTSFLGVPRVWEKIQEGMKDIGAKSSLVKKKIADWAKGIGLQASYNTMDKYVLSNHYLKRGVSLCLEFFFFTEICK